MVASHGEGAATGPGPGPLAKPPWAEPPPAEPAPRGQGHGEAGAVRPCTRQGGAVQAATGRRLLGIVEAVEAVLAQQLGAAAVLGVVDLPRQPVHRHALL